MGGSSGDRDLRSRLRAAEEDAEDARATISVLRRRIAAYEEEMREERRSHRERMRELEDQLARGGGGTQGQGGSQGGVDFGEFMEAQAAAATARQAAQEAQVEVARLEAELHAALERAERAERASATSQTPQANPTGGGGHSQGQPHRPKRGGVVVDLDMGGGVSSDGGPSSGGGLARTPPRSSPGSNAELKSARAEIARLEIALSDARDEIATLKRKLTGEASTRQIAEGRATALQNQLREVQSQCDQLRGDLADAVAKRELMADELKELKGGNGGSKRGSRHRPHHATQEQRPRAAQGYNQNMQSEQPTHHEHVQTQHEWSHAEPTHGVVSSGPIQGGSTHSGGPSRAAAEAMRAANKNAAAANAARQRSSGFTFGDLGDGESAPPSKPSSRRQSAPPQPETSAHSGGDWKPDLHPHTQRKHEAASSQHDAYSAVPQHFARQPSPAPPSQPYGGERYGQQQVDDFTGGGFTPPSSGGMPPHMSEMQRRMDMLNEMASQQQPAAVPPPRYGGGGGYSVAPPAAPHSTSHPPPHMQTDSDPADMLRAQFAAAASRAGGHSHEPQPHGGGHGFEQGGWQPHSSKGEGGHSSRSPKQHAVASMQARQASTPFATAHTLDADVTAVGDAQAQLLQVNQSLDRTRAELERFGGGMGRSIADRRRKAELEASMARFEKRASELRLWLKHNEFA